MRIDQPVEAAVAANHASCDAIAGVVYRAFIYRVSFQAGTGVGQYLFKPDGCGVGGNPCGDTAWRNGNRGCQLGYGCASGIGIVLDARPVVAVHMVERAIGMQIIGVVSHVYMWATPVNPLIYTPYEIEVSAFLSVCIGIGAIGRSGSPFVIVAYEVYFLTVTAVGWVVGVIVDHAVTEVNRTLVIGERLIGGAIYLTAVEARITAVVMRQKVVVIRSVYASGYGTVSV